MWQEAGVVVPEVVVFEVHNLQSRQLPEIFRNDPCWFVGEDGYWWWCDECDDYE